MLAVQRDQDQQGHDALRSLVDLLSFSFHEASFDMVMPWTHFETIFDKAMLWIFSGDFRFHCAGFLERYDFA